MLQIISRPYDARLHVCKGQDKAFPAKADVKHPYIFGGIRSVINVSEKEDKDIVSLYHTEYLLDDLTDFMREKGVL